MDPLVVVQGGQLLKRPATGTTDMGLFVTVVQQMLVVALLEREGLSADGTRVGHLTWGMGERKCQVSIRDRIP